MGKHKSSLVILSAKEFFNLTKVTFLPLLYSIVIGSCFAQNNRSCLRYFCKIILANLTTLPINPLN